MDVVAAVELTFDGEVAARLVGGRQDDSPFAEIEVSHDVVLLLAVDELIQDVASDPDARRKVLVTLAVRYDEHRTIDAAHATVIPVAVADERVTDLHVVNCNLKRQTTAIYAAPRN